MHGGDVDVTRFPLDRGVVFAQSSRQKQLYESRGLDTILVAHHSTVTMKENEGKYPYKETTTYPSQNERFRVGMIFGSGGDAAASSASEIEFNWTSTEFHLVAGLQFNFSDYLSIHADLVWTKNEVSKSQ